MGDEAIIAALDSAEEDAGPGEDRPVSPLDAECAKLLRNDVGNGERLRAREGPDLAWVPGLGWAVWNGAIWDAQDGGLEAQKRAQKTARSIFAEAKTIEPPSLLRIEDEVRAAGGDDDAVKAKLRAAQDAHRKSVAAMNAFARASGNSGKISAMLAEAAPHLKRRADQFDARPLMLAVANGVLALGSDGSAKFRGHDKSLFLTRSAAAAFEKGAAAPRWRAFLERVQPDPAVRAFLQRSIGLALTGLTSAQVFWIHHGTGRNGKGTFLGTLRAVLGDCAVFMPNATFGEARKRRSGGEASPDVMRLRAARFVQLSDLSEGFELDDGFIKQVTGEEPIVARKLHGDFVEFLPTFKLHFTCNTKPKIRAIDDGAWRRVLLVDWPVQIPEAEIDPGLGEALRAEAPGILAWALEGWAAFCREGLKPPASVRAATEAYRADSDPLADFLGLWCDLGPALRCSIKELFEKYEAFCKANGMLAPKSSITLGKQLGRRGFKAVKSGGLMKYLGLDVRAEARDEAQAVTPRTPAFEAAGHGEDGENDPPQGGYWDADEGAFIDDS